MPGKKPGLQGRKAMKSHCRNNHTVEKFNLAGVFRSERQEGGRDSGSYYNSPDHRKWKPECRQGGREREKERKASKNKIGIKKKE